MTSIEQFISDLIESAEMVRGTPKQIDRFKANILFAISYARKKAVERNPEDRDDV